jgi:putative transposase
MVTAVRERTRVAAGREPTPSVAGIDRQAVKTTERGGPERGYDGGQNIKGRKRHLLVDTLGWLRAVLITSARLDDGGAAPLLLSHVTLQDLPRRVTIFADQQYPNQALEAWMAEHRTGWRIEAPARPEGRKGFTPLAKRWVIERTHAWHGRYRRNSKDDERRVASRTAMSHISHVPLMLQRLAPCDRPAFHYHQDAA